jgi:hypothetical protein
MFSIVSFGLTAYSGGLSCNYEMPLSAMETPVKKSLILPLALAILVPAVSLAQDAPKPAAHKPRTVAGLVSPDAKTFLDAKQSQWAVANPTALSGYENQRVKVKYLLAADQKQIQILSVKPVQAQIQNTAFKTDSAFRR